MTAEAPEGYFGTEELARLVNSTPDDQLANGLRANGDRIVEECLSAIPGARLRGGQAPDCGDRVEASRTLEFLKLVTGNANPVAMFLTGKLKIRGDLLFAARVQGFFSVPGG